MKSSQRKLYEVPNLSVKPTAKTKANRLFTLTDTFDSMPLLSIWLVIAGVYGTSGGFYSFTGSRDVFHIHPTPQMSQWTASDSTVTNGSKFFPLFSQLWKNSRFGAVSTNGSQSDLRYAVADVWEDNESYHLETCQTVSRKGGSPEDERQNEFSNVVTNSGGALIGGSCTGGLFLLGVLIYLLYRLLKEDLIIHPTPGHVPQPDAVTNQNRAPCPRCRNVPSSPPPDSPPAYNEVFAMEECVCSMSAPPANSKHPTNGPTK